MNWKQIFFSGASLRLGWNLLFYLFIVTITIAVIVTPVVFLLSLFDLSPQIGKPVTGWTSIAGSIIVLFSGYFAFLIGTHLSQKWLRKKDLYELGLKLNRESVKDLFYGILLGGLIVGIEVFLCWIFGWYELVGFSWQLNDVGIIIPTFVLLLFTKIQPALLEEVIFRGYFFQVFLERLSLKNTVLITSLLFGLLHFSSTAEYPWWAAITSAAIAGLLFAQAYLFNNNLFLPIGIHYGWHIFGRLLNDTGVEVEKTILLVSNVTGPNLLTPTEGGGTSLFGLVGVGTVSLILYYLKKAEIKSHS
ncbi:lysostaphin resistance A-like protein [Bacteroidota bacterium]